jgi:methyl-accepting chemotaxis protein
MDQVTQSNAANAEESAAAAEELNAQAEIMKQSVAELLRLVGSSGEASFATPRQASAGVIIVKRPVPPGAFGPRRSHSPATPSVTATTQRRAAIPMAGEFKDF